jgi:signal transduction histidine kinase
MGRGRYNCGTVQIRSFFAGLTWAQRFLLASLVILAAGMAAIGAWMTSQIEQGVVHRTAETAAVYVDSAIAPYLQNLEPNGELDGASKEKLDALFRNTRLGEQVPSFKVWSPTGRVVYSTGSEITGQTFPIEGGLARALAGEVAAEISALDEEENVNERARGQPLLEIYSPVRRAGSDEVIASAEFYQSVEDLQLDVAVTVRQTWLLMGAVTVIMYLLLAGFVRVASNTIVRQQSELSAQVRRLQELVTTNARLDERVRHAAAQTTALNERVLRRISAELHDGPAQDVGLALLKLDNVIARTEGADTHPSADGDLDAVKRSLDHALAEIRAISSGMGVPQLAELTLNEIVARAVRTHERRTNTRVTWETIDLPAQTDLPIKITLFRVLQESLNNAYRHAGGVGQEVRVEARDKALAIQVSDRGRGTNGQAANDDAEHLGIVGMRERVESLGGTFEFESMPGDGARVRARLPLEKFRDAQFL